MVDEKYYENILKLLMRNIILYVSDIAKVLGRSLAEFTEPVGFSISAVSRIRKKIKESPESVLENISYALSMLSALDTIYLFERIDKDVREEIEKMLLENLCEDIIVFHHKDKPVTTCEIEAQRWFRMDYKYGKGFVYQVQFFLHEISKINEEKEFQLIEAELLQKLKEAKVAFTVMGLKSCRRSFQEIINSLKDNYLKDSTQVKIYFSSVINDEIYYDNISKDLLPDDVEVCPTNTEYLKVHNLKEDSYIPHYIKDFVDIISFCLKDNAYLVLFVEDEDNMLRYLRLLKNNEDKIIFAYNRYFERLGCFQIVFDYKRNIIPMKFIDSVSTFENTLGL